MGEKKGVPVSFKLKTISENINAIGGISFVDKFLLQTDFDSAINKIRTTSIKPVYSNGNILRTYLGLLVQGRFSFDDLNLFRDDQFFIHALGLGKCCSEERLRQRMDGLADKIDVILRDTNIQLLKDKPFSTVSTAAGDLIPCDCDVSPMDNSRSKKENVSFTYKQFDGYAPMFSYIGAQGFMLDCELRPGSQHCENGTQDFLKRVIAHLNELKITSKTLFRLDSGNDSQANLDIISPNSYYIIKRNLRKEPKEMWLKTAIDCGEKFHPRDGKVVYVGHYHSEKYHAPIVFKVTVRTTDAKGERFLIPDLQVETYWTNLPDSPERIIELYHDHGTSEQFHSELKSDMNIERLPSGKFKTNELILQLAMLAFNMLRSIGQQIIDNNEFAPVKIKVKRLRLKTVIRDIINIPCKYVRHAKQHFLNFGRNCKWFNIFKELYQST